MSKVTITAIESIVNPKKAYKKGLSNEVLGMIYESVYEAMRRADIKKTDHYYSNADWRKVAKEVKKMIEKPSKGLKGSPKKRKSKKVKTPSCRTAGHQMSTAKSTALRKAGAKKLGSKKCKTKAQIKKSTSKVAEISKLAKKIRKSGEAWTAAIKRASKQVA